MAMGDYWTDNGIEKPRQIVVCAACQHPTNPDLMLTGARHWDKVMRKQFNSLKPPYPSGANWVQGFIDQFGDFLTREEAMGVVKANGQYFNFDRNKGDTALFSEGLY